MEQNEGSGWGASRESNLPDPVGEASKVNAGASGADVAGLSRSLDVVLENLSLRLCGGGGAFYPDAAAMLVADLHLGKGASFRKHSIPVPRGSTAATLDRVSELIVRNGASQLFILGDLFHHPASLSAGAVEAFVRFCGEHPDVTVKLVRGNHDRGIDRYANELPIEVVDEGYPLRGLRLRHHPPEAAESSRAGESVTVAGHLHPAFRLRSASEDLGRQRCFWYASRCLVLPAIGQFTGTSTVRPGRGDRVWVDVGDRVMEVGRGVARRGRSTQRVPR
jgi:DNA ligase-associated metallophosphoesterase